MPHTLPDIGDLVAGKYRLTAKLGEGGYGVVYKAYHETMGRDVALKMLRPEAAQHPEEIERFRREVFNASCLRHPNTITLYDYGQTPTGALFIVMEYLKGMNLRLWVKRHGPFEHDAAVDIIEQILRSLREAHAVGVLHRDLKPENLFLTEISEDERLVKVLDFGLSKAFGKRKRRSNQRTLTKQGQVYGTPQYMSPEQACAQKLTPASDVYAVGLLAYEMLTGEPAFDANTAVDVLLKQVNEPTPELPSPLNHSALAGFITHTTCKDAEQRPADARAALAALLEAKEATRTVEHSATIATPAIVATGLAPAPEPSASVEPWFGSSGPGVIDAAELDMRLAGLPMVGRSEELHELLRWGRQALQTGGVLWVTGDMGVGKSRLVEEWLRHMEMHSVAILRGRHLDESLALSGLREALSPLMDGELSGLQLPATSLDPIDVERLRDLLDPQRAAELGPLETPDWAFAAIERVLYAITKRRPVILVLEDLHAADSFTRRLAEHWQEDMSTRPLPLLLVFTECGERAPEIALRATSRLGRVGDAAFTYAHALHVRALDESAANELLDELLPFEPRLRSRITHTARGNPLYLTQIVRYLVDEGLVEYDSTSRTWNVILSGDLDVQLLPPDLEALLTQRVTAQIEQHRLGPVLDAVLARALLLGNRFETRLLKEVLRMEGRGDLESYLDDTLEAFTQAGVLVPTVIDGRPGLEFGYEMLRASMLESRIADDEHATLHDVVARTKIQYYAQRSQGRLEEASPEIARHYIEAGRRRIGLEWMMRAAKMAERLQDFREALDHLRMAYTLLDESLDPDGEHALEVRLAQGRLYRNLGEFGPAEDALREALDEARRVGDTVGEALTAEALAGVLTLVTRYDEAIEVYDEIEPLYSQFGDRAGGMRCALGRAEISRFRGRYAEARRAFERLLQDGGEIGDVRIEIRALFGLGRCAYAAGKLESASALFRQARKRSEALGDAPMASDADLELALVALGYEHVEQALTMANQALELKRSIGDSLGVAHAHLICGMCLRRTLRVDQAKSHARRARSLNERVSHLYGIAKAVLLQSEILWTQGDPKGALEPALDALRMHQQIGDAHGEALCYMHISMCHLDLLAIEDALEASEHGRRIVEEHDISVLRPMLIQIVGMVAEHRDDFEIALELYTKGLEFADASGALEWRVFGAINVAKLNMMIGRHDEARVRVREALELSERLGHAYLMMFTLTLRVITARLDREPEALASSLRRLRVLHDNSDSVNMRIPSRVHYMVRVMLRTQPSERAFAAVLASVELLRALGADALADALAAQVMSQRDG